MTKILGISAFYHDSAAALIIDGKIVAAAQEERFSRKKHDPQYPFNAIEYVLKESKLNINNIDHIVFFEKPFLKFERLLETYMAFAPKGFKSFSLSMPIWLREKLFQKKFLFDKLQQHDENFNDTKKIKFSEHHYSHAASAFYPSPFKDAVILTLDGVGEWATTTVAIGNENKLEILKEIHFPHSLGLLYSAFTYYTGFKVNSGEYKLMGLAPYGKPIFKELIINKLLDLKDDGSFKLNMKYFNYATGLTMTNNKFSKLFGHSVREPKKVLLNEFHMNIAASIQAVTEEIVLRLTKNIAKEYKVKNLCLAGGVALNCVANGKILKSEIFDNIWIQPAAGDAGGSLGAALAYWHHELKMPRNEYKDQMQGSYLGPKFENNLIEEKPLEFAKENLIKNYESLNEVIKFQKLDVLLSNINQKFDYVVSKDTFEHTVNLPKVLQKIYNILNVGGRAYLGFGPLYNFYNGDHGRLNMYLPWFHLLFKEKFLINRVNKKENLNIKKIQDLGLSKYSFADYKNFFEKSNFKIKYFKTNLSDHPISFIFNTLSKIKFLEEFC
ncbi:carbamoyltransferase N-terminal domain-containing protein, partial [Pelagibacteraceae bacterium]|nr:carbamoyltransferase N-terminal domain-containing protein [Pelagibacteraceae bacterium]